MLNKIKTSYLVGAMVILFFVFLISQNRQSFSQKFLKTNSSEAQAIKVSCDKNLKVYGSSENCYTQELRKVAKKNGLQYSFEILNNLQKIDPSARGCHLIAHGIGAGSYEKDPENWRELVRTMPTLCNYGSIHGVIEEYIGSLPDKSLKREIIPTICGETPRADCNHIVGHLLLVETDANISKALDLCEVFTEDRQNAFCITGVFMEYQTALNLIEHKLVPRSWQNWPARLDELEKMCRSYSGKQAEGCWEEIVHVALVKFKNNPQKIFDFCNSAQTKVGAEKCKRHSLGIIAAARNFDFKILEPICRMQKDYPNFESECYPALVASALSTIPATLPDAVDFCSDLPTGFKENCFSIIGVMQFSGSLSKVSLINACRNVSSDYKDYCLGEKSNFNQPQIRNND